MELKQDTIEDIIQSEETLLRSAPEKYGESFEFAMDVNALLQDCIVSAEPTHHLFVLFLSQIRKHVLLAIFSSVRLHKTQSQMDIRQVLEAGVNAAYSIAHTDVSGFAEINEDGILDAKQELRSKRNKWLEANHAAASISIKGMKTSINESTSHSNIINGMLNFTYDSEDDSFKTPFFDIENEYHVKTDLWMVGDIAFGLMDLFYGVNLEYKVLTFTSNFLDRMKTLKAKDISLKNKMMSDSAIRSDLTRFVAPPPNTPPEISSTPSIPQ